VDGDTNANVLFCIRCRLTIRYADSHTRAVSDLLASHWADDHHLAVWRDAAAGPETVCGDTTRISWRG